MTEFRKALPEELESINTLYRSLIGKDFCVWNDSYPGMADIRYDFGADCLYVLTVNGKIAGAISVVPENEMDDFDYWNIRGIAAREIARVAVAKEHQGKGFARYMVKSVFEILKADGFSAVHLSVCEGNIPALKVYTETGFTEVGEADMYGGHYILMEKAL